VLSLLYCRTTVWCIYCSNFMVCSNIKTVVGTLWQSKQLTYFKGKIKSTHCFCHICHSAILCQAKSQTNKSFSYCNKYIFYCSVTRTGSGISNPRVAHFRSGFDVNAAILQVRINEYELHLYSMEAIERNNLIMNELKFLLLYISLTLSLSLSHAHTHTAVIYTVYKL